MSSYQELTDSLREHPRTWLVTGCAGFIGSNIIESLLTMGQRVIGLDNFATGFRHNLQDVRKCVGEEPWSRFKFIEGDIRELATCQLACDGVEVVLHQAALGSVPRSIKDPISSHQTNVDGFLNMLVAAKDAGIQRFVFASSSSVYGDHPDLPKIEENIGRPLSPYALTKSINEQYAKVFAHTYGFHTIGLRYFNVFGRRQSPNGPYAAVIPKWIATLLNGESCQINGDGETSRDFCFVANAVQANILAGLGGEEALAQVFNISFGGRTTLSELYFMIRQRLIEWEPRVAGRAAIYSGFRAGDISHSNADISKARRLLGYRPTHSVAQGLDETTEWFVQNLGPQ